MYWRMDDSGLHCRVSPFGNPRITGCLLLPVAYRSLSRPSSAPSAKASTSCTYQLNRFPHASHVWYLHCLALQCRSDTFETLSFFGLPILHWHTSDVFHDVFLRHYKIFLICSFQGTIADLRSAFGDFPSGNSLLICALRKLVLNSEIFLRKTPLSPALTCKLVL